MPQIFFLLRWSSKINLKVWVCENCWVFFVDSLCGFFVVYVNCWRSICSFASTTTMTRVEVTAIFATSKDVHGIIHIQLSRNQFSIQVRIEWELRKFKACNESWVNTTCSPNKIHGKKIATICDLEFQLFNNRRYWALTRLDRGVRETFLIFFHIYIHLAYRHDKTL